MRHFALVLLAAMVPAMGQSLTPQPLPNPAGDASLQPNWSAAPDGSAILSWIEPAKDGSYSLRYAVRRGPAWSEARTVIARRRFFRHPAEVPEVAQLGDRQWLARWIEMPDEASEAEFINVSSSTDGLKWTAPVMAHKDRSPVQHGLASMVASGPNETSVIWLATPMGEDGPAHLMRTVVDALGKEIREERLDPDVCSCCPTSVVKTAKGLLIAYRDHTPEDIRDISVLRFENGKWSQPKTLNADKWKINACPINAASAAAKGDHVAIAWFTGAQDSPRVQVAFSADSGTTFGKPVTIGTGRAFGYAAAVLDDGGNAIVSWLERAADGSARVLVRQVSPAGVAGPVAEVAHGERQSLGYPRLSYSAGGTFIAWGNAKPGSKVQTARLR